jgi:hypothetical protein
LLIVLTLNNIKNFKQYQNMSNTASPASSSTTTSSSTTSSTTTSSSTTSPTMVSSQISTETKNNVSVGICGLGCVGDAMYQHFLKNTDMKPVGYDKYKEPFDSKEVFQELLETDMVFLCLPTLYSPEIDQYDKSAIFDVCKRLNEGKYKGLIVLKSTVEPGTTDDLNAKYPMMDFAHNPEFLTARTSYEDFTNQPHVVIGRTQNCDPEKFQKLIDFYKRYWPNSQYSVRFFLFYSHLTFLFHLFFISYPFLTQISGLLCT